MNSIILPYEQEIFVANQMSWESDAESYFDRS